MKSIIVVEVRELKRLSKKIKENYYIIGPGEHFFTHVSQVTGDRLTFMSDNGNLNAIHIGKK